MKAEHRKELETNILADRVGRFVQGIRQRPQRRVFVYVLAGVVVVVGIFVFLNIKKSSALETSERWREFEDGFRPYIDRLRTEHKDINVGKAARFQYAWIELWDEGLARLGSNPVIALAESADHLGGVGRLAIAEKLYKDLLEDCKDDPVWEPEALYALALIEETRAIRLRDREKHLDRAKTLYRKLADTYKDSAHGKDARKRAKLLEEKGKDIAAFYIELGERLDIEKAFAEAEKTIQKKQKK